METVIDKSQCRICLQGNATVSLFENNNSPSIINFKLFTCTGEEVQYFEYLPNNICETCNNMVNNAYDLIVKYRESKKIFDNIFIDIKIEPGLYNCKLEESLQETKIEDILNITSENNEVFYKGIKIKKVPKEERNIDYDSFEDICYMSEIDEKSIPQKKKQLRKLKGSKENNKSKKKRSPKQKKIGKEKIKLFTKKKENPIKTTDANANNDENCKIKNKVEKKTNSTICHICGETFGTVDRLQRHINRTHAQVKCSQCDHTSTSEYYLNLHIRRKHSDEERKFVCPTCNGKFINAKDLRSHIRSVHGPKIRKYKGPFTCQFCSKVYDWQKSLEVHIRSAHTGERPAVCNVCSAAFHHNENLRQHMRLHTGETPYKCPVCPKGFAQLCNLKSHISHNHRLADLDQETIKGIKPQLLRHFKDVKT